jgi:predicted alpha/beta superfamily hydrolase
MKVICVNVKYKNHDYKNNLTIGKIYDGNYDKNYAVIWIWQDDMEHVFNYPIELFEKLNNYRNNKINKLLGK